MGIPNMRGKSQERAIEKPALEISRRIMTGQRAKFEFLDLLQGVVALDESDLMASPNEVRVNLISRFDRVLRDSSPRTAGQAQEELDIFFDVINVSTCDQFCSASLGEPVVVERGNGWRTVEMPIVESDYQFGIERVALTGNVDRKMYLPGRDWSEEEPALQVVEFRADDRDTARILDLVGVLASRETEVFDASVRFRQPVE